MQQNKIIQSSTKEETKSKKVVKRWRFSYFIAFIVLFLNISRATTDDHIKKKEISRPKEYFFSLVDQVNNDNTITGEKSTYRYSKVDKIGEGGYANVYKGKDTETEAYVAIKAIKKMPNSSKIIDDYRTEIQIMQKLNHPNIIKFIDKAETSDTLYIITELCNEGDLLDKLVQNSNFDEKIALHLFQELWTGVEYLHSQDIAHRDLKLENIMFCNNSPGSTMLKIIDFGFAYDEKDNHGKITGGTLNYMAPEVISLPFSKCPKIYQNIEMMKKADVWSMGVILYLFLSGDAPWSFKLSEEALYKKVTNYTANFPDKSWDKVSKNTKHLVEVMLIANPHHRVNLKQIKYISEQKNKKVNLKKANNNPKVLRIFSNKLK